MTTNAEPVHLSGSAIGEIRQLTEKAGRTTLLKFPGDDTRTAVLDPSGKIDDVLVPPRDYRAYTLDGLIEQVRDLANATSPIGPPIIIDSEQEDEIADQLDVSSVDISGAPSASLWGRLRSLLSWMNAEAVRTVSP